MSIKRKIKITLDATEAKAGIDALAKKLNSLTGSTGKLTNAQQRQAKGQGALNKKIVDTNRSLNAMNGLLRKVATAAALFTGIKLADDFNELQNRLRLTLQTGEKLIDVQQGIVEVSLRTRSSLAENALLYLRLSNSVDRNVTSQSDLLRITETVNKAVQLGGSSAQEAAGAVRQFTQIISAGFSSGFSQEINSISEQTPGLFKLITNGLRATSEEFRELEATGLGAVKVLKTFSEEGIGDLDMLLKAINSQMTVTNDMFGKIEVTVSKAMGNLKSSIEVYIGKLDDATGITPRLASKINNLALNFDKLAFDISIVAVSFASAMVVLAGFFAAMKVWTVITMLFNVGLKATLASMTRISAVAAVAFAPVTIVFVAISTAVALLIKDLAVFEDGVVRVGDKFTTIGGLFKAIIEVISDRFKNLGENLKKFFKFLGDASSKAFKFMKKSAANDLRIIREELGFVGDAVAETSNFIAKQTPFSGWIDMLGTLANVAIGTFSFIAQLIKSVLEGIFEDFINLGSGVVGLVKSLPSILLAALKGDGEKAGELLATAFGDGFKGGIVVRVGDAIKAAKDTITGTDYVGDLKGKGEKLSEVVFAFTNNLPEKVAASLKNIFGAASLIWDDFKEDVEDKIVDITKLDAIWIRGLDRFKNIKPPPPVPKETLSTWEKFGEIINALGDAVVAFTGLFSTLSDIRQSKIDEELKTSTSMSNEERKVKEANAKKAFDNSKQLTLAGIALATGLAIMNAMADTSTTNFYVKLANAAGAAAMGATQYAKASAQQYKAPSAPSGGGIGSGASNVSTNTQNITTTVNITGGVGFTIDDLRKVFDDDAIIINRDSAQGRIFSG